MLPANYIPPRKGRGKKARGVYGIDIGQSATKVAFSALQLLKGETCYTDVESLKYPTGIPDHAMPTMVAYLKGKLVLGTFNPQDPNLEIYQGFKDQALQPKNLLLAAVGGNGQRLAHDVYCDHLKGVLLWVRRHWEENLGPAGLGSFDEAQIIFYFSVPALVDKQNGREVLLRLAREAGFSIPNPDGKSKKPEYIHDVCIEQSEGPAVVHAALNSSDKRFNIQIGNTVMVVDIGALTSDVTIMAVLNRFKYEVDKNFLQRESSVASGIHLNDDEIQEMIEEILQPFATMLPDGKTPKQMAFAIRLSEMYFVAKSEEKDLNYPIAIAGDKLSFPVGNDGSEIRFKNGVLHIDNAVFAEKLDHRLIGCEFEKRIATQIRVMVHDLFIRNPGRSYSSREENGLESSKGVENTRLDFLILTGATCSNRRVEKLIKQAIRSHNPNYLEELGLAEITEKTKVFTMDEPHYATVNGLVLEGTRQQMGLTASIFRRVDNGLVPFN